MPCNDAGQCTREIGLCSIRSVRLRGKITTCRREGVGVVVEKKKKVELSTKIRVIYLQQ